MWWNISNEVCVTFKKYMFFSSNILSHLFFGTSIPKHNADASWRKRQPLFPPTDPPRPQILLSSPGYNHSITQKVELKSINKGCRTEWKHEINYSPNQQETFSLFCFQVRFGLHRKQLGLNDNRNGNSLSQSSFRYVNEIILQQMLLFLLHQWFFQSI